MKKSLAIFAAYATCITAVHPAFANDDYKLVDRSFEVLGSIGYTWLRGNERVYDGNNLISHLIWETSAPLLQLSARTNLQEDWTIKAKTNIAFSGNSYMEDYDWLLPHLISYDFDDWTHRSQHPDTRLDRYWDIDIAIGRDFALAENYSINLHGGFRHTNVKWTSYGGSFVYSRLAFRDSVGTFPSAPGISYEQSFPGLYLGAEVEAQFENWTLSGYTSAGLTVAATAVDHHWARGLRFDETYKPKPFISLGAQVDYRVGTNTSAYLAGSYDHYFHTKGDVTEYDIPTGTYLAGPIADEGGSDLSAFKLAGGLKVQF